MKMLPADYAARRVEAMRRRERVDGKINFPVPVSACQSFEASAGSLQAGAEKTR